MDGSHTPDGEATQDEGLRPLDGFRVVEVASWLAVPTAGGILAEWGADVVKVEPPSGGDPMRGLRPSLAGTRPLNMGLHHANRQKRSVAVDLRSAAGHEVFERLVAASDVMLTNYLEPVRTRLKIDVSDVRAVNADIIYARASGLGPRGPEKDRPGYDFTSFWCRAGVASELQAPGMPYPLPQPGGNGDVLTGAMLASGICAALLRRERTGRTAVVDASLLGTGVWMMMLSLTAAASGQRFNAQSLADRAQPNNPLINIFRTRDDRYIGFAMPQSDKDWPEVCTYLDLGVVDDPRFATMEARKENTAALTSVIDAVMAMRTLAEWKERLGGMQAVWEPVQTMHELAVDPQVTENGYLQPLVGADTHESAPTHLISAPAQFDEHAFTTSPAPELGQDTETVLLELGYSWDDVVDLKLQGAII